MRGSGRDNLVKLSICRVGLDRVWLASYACQGITDLLFHDGELFFTTAQCAVHSLNLQRLFHGKYLFHLLAQLERKFVHPDQCIPFMIGRCMVDSCGELPVATLYQEAGDSMIIFRVHKLEEPKLVIAEELGDRLLFAGRGCSMSWSGKEWSDGFFTKNCIYYVTPCDFANFSCWYGHVQCRRDKLRVHSCGS